MTPAPGDRPLKLLVLLPDLADDGAAREAADLLEAGTRSGALSFEAIAWGDGPGLDALARLGPVSVVSGLAAGGTAALAERALLKAGAARGGHAVRRRRLGIGPWTRHRPDAVYLASPRAAPLLRYLPPTLGGPVVVMVPHGEMTPTEHEPLSDDDRALLLARADRFLVQTDASRERLADLGVPDPKVVQIGEPLPDGLLTPPPAGRLDALRARLGIEPGTPVIVGSGPLVWQGGADLFVRTLWILRARRNHDVVGVWVGSATEPLERRQLDHDITHMGLDDHMHVLGPEDEDALWLGGLQVLTSRQVDEPAMYRGAAMRGQAFVGFRTDALERFVGDGAGRLFEFLDLEHLATAIAEVLDDSALAALTAAVAARFAQWHLPSERPHAVVDLIREAR